MYSADIVSSPATSGEQIMKLYNKYISIFIIMNIASQIIGQQQNMRQFQIMSLSRNPHLGSFYDEIWPARWQAQNRYLKI